MNDAAATARYDTVAKQAMFDGENLPGNRVWDGTQVAYPSDAELARLRLSIVQGELRDAEGGLFDTSDAQTLWSGPGRAIFVMDASGQFLVSKRHAVGRFHHSSLGQGGPVAGAGEMEVRAGTLVALTDHSSHYCPPRWITEQVLRELQSRGVDLARVLTEFRY